MNDKVEIEDKDAKCPNSVSQRGVVKPKLCTSVFQRQVSNTSNQVADVEPGMDASYLFRCYGNAEIELVTPKNPAEGMTARTSGLVDVINLEIRSTVKFIHKQFNC